MLNYTTVQEYLAYYSFFTPVGNTHIKTALISLTCWSSPIFMRVLQIRAPASKQASQHIEGLFWMISRNCDISLIEYSSTVKSCNQKSRSQHFQTRIRRMRDIKSNWKEMAYQVLTFETSSGQENRTLPCFGRES